MEEPGEADSGEEAFMDMLDAAEGEGAMDVRGAIWGPP